MFGSKVRKIGILLRFFSVSVSYLSCPKESPTTYDECGRRCECKKGKLTNCFRVRKEFNSMTYKERERYVITFYTASTKEPFRTKYRKLIRIHRQLFFTNIHQVDEFLPWHRWFMLELENLLKEVDCRFTIPYWDWSLTASNPWSSSHVWHPSSRGLGGNGDPPGECVKTGVFQVTKNFWVSFNLSSTNTSNQ